MYADDTVLAMMIHLVQNNDTSSKLFVSVDVSFRHHQANVIHHDRVPNPTVF